MSWWNITGYALLSLVVWLLVLGACITVVYGIVKGMLWCLGLTHWALSWAWAKLTGKPPSSHGTAHWAREAEISVKGLFTPGSIPLGTWKGRPLYEALGGHVALIGPPRSRKSWGLLMPAINGWEGSILVNDPRGELWTSTHLTRETCGPTYRFSPTQQASNALNVLDAVRWGEPEAFGDVQRCIHGILSPDPGEPWNDFRLEAEPLLIAVVLDRQAAGEGHFPAVLKWMTAPDRSMKQKAEALLQSPIPAVSAGGRRFLDKSPRLATAVWSAALSALTIYQDPLVAQHTAHSDLDLSDLQHGTRPVSLYLTPPFADVSRLRPLLGTLTEMLVSRFSTQQDRPRQRVLLALDEAMNLGRLAELERGLSFLQGCSVQTLLVMQNVVQFRHTYGPNSPLLASVATKVCYTPSDPDTRNYVAEELGVTTARLHPETEHHSFWGLLQSVSIGTSEHERPLLTPDEVGRLPETAAVVLMKGCAPILGEKLGAEASPVQTTMQQTKPILKRVAMLAGAFLVTAGMTTWVLWPDATPAPVVSKTSLLSPEAERQADHLIAKYQAQGEALRDELGPEAHGVPGADRMLIREPMRYGLYKSVSGPGTWPSVTKEWIGGSFLTAEACDTALKQRLDTINQLIASQQPGRVHMQRAERGFNQTLGPRSTRQERWFCVQEEDQPS